MVFCSAAIIQFYQLLFISVSLYHQLKDARQVGPRAGQNMQKKCSHGPFMGFCLKKAARVFLATLVSKIQDGVIGE